MQSQQHWELHVGQLVQIRTTSVRNNLLTTMPASLGQPVQIRTTRARNNLLTTMPASLGQLVQIRNGSYKTKTRYTSEYIDIV
jgi:Leucine-rich repeat (LRR) protein